MKVADLSPEVIEKIKTLRYDRIYEKHEGPERWESDFRYGDPEFIIVENHAVLLPIDREYHVNITILRLIMSDDAKTLTIFFKDTTFYDDPFDSGFLAICEKFPGESFYVATVYHEWFILDNELFNAR